ncbi:MAG: phosphate signaling complex protein PhoU [bacterium]|nr:phosphate signaling complex protein PhoU [bacterium]
MGKHLHNDLEKLERELISMSSMVEEAIKDACKILLDRKTELADAVFTREDEIDRREVHIEDESLKILALHQPVAVDLRRCAAILKINNDLERVADLAVNIVERANGLVKFPEFEPPKELTEMSEIAVDMLKESLDAFVQSDVDLARSICLRDSKLNELNCLVIAELEEKMQSGNSVPAAIHFFSASRHIERIGDHATNIAEDVIYLVEGEIARHNRRN